MHTLSLALFTTAGCAAAAPSPPTAPPPQVPASSPASSSGPALIGTPHPYTLVDADPERRWVVLCQARLDTNNDGLVNVFYGHHGGVYGDEMRPFLIGAEGKGDPIDAYLGSDPSGRFVVVRSKGVLLLHDMSNGLVTNLSDRGLDEDEDPSGGARAISFGAPNGSLLLLPKPGGPPVVLMQELSSGNSSSVVVGEGRVWHAWLAPTEDWLFATVVMRDANGNGTLDLPTIRTNRVGNACGSPLSYSTHGLEKDHDELEDRVVPIRGGAPRSAEGLVAFFGKRLLRRTASGSVVLEDVPGAAQEIIPASCDGPIVAANARVGAVIAACGAGRARNRRGDPATARQDVRLVDFRVGARHELGIAPSPYVGELDAADDDRFIWIPGADDQSFVYDYEAKTLRVIGSVDLCAERRGDVLYRGKDESTWLSTPSGVPRLVSKGACYRSRASRGRWALVADELFDFEAARLVGKLPGICSRIACDDRREALSISLDGRVLTEIDRDSMGVQREELIRRIRLAAADRPDRSAPIGPLEWTAALPDAESSEGAR